jgi:hypothetical protein
MKIIDFHFVKKPFGKLKYWMNSAVKPHKNPPKLDANGIFFLESLLLLRWIMEFDFLQILNIQEDHSAIEQLLGLYKK